MKNILAAILAAAAAAAHGELRIVATDQSDNSIVVFDGSEGAAPEFSWKWNARTDPGVLPEYKNAFRNIDECKPRSGGAEILVCASAGGVACIDAASAKAKWYAFMPDSHEGPHSLEILPGGFVAVANSTGVNALQIVDVSASPLDPGGQKIATAMPMPGAHGVVWDGARESLFALAYTNLYELACDGMSVSVKRKWDFTGIAGDAYGHDLVPDGRGGYFITNHTAVWHFNPDSEKWTKEIDIADVKSFSRDASAGDLLSIPKEKWWTDELRAIRPDGSKRSIGPFPGARFYKARWF